MINFESVDSLRGALLKNNYLVDRKVATTVFLAVKMQKPLLVEGPAGVGKTYLARALAWSAGCELIRLQCYPGLDESKALYEWNYQKQLLYLQTAREDACWEKARSGIYSQEFLLPRPVLRAFLSPSPVVLLIDEIDKSDDELESFLLEALSEYQVSIPEMGTVKCQNNPLVIITSNNSRDFSDALKRRCLHLHIPFPGKEREEAIIRMHLGDQELFLARQVAEFLSRVRKMSLRKLPGISESIDWARSLISLGIKELSPESVGTTLNALLKYEEDIAAIESRVGEIAGDLAGNPAAVKKDTETPEIGDLPPEQHILSRFNF